MIIVKTLVWGYPVGGYPSMVCLITFVGGVQLFCTGILGQYLSKVYLETKKRPIYNKRGDLDFMNKIKRQSLILIQNSYFPFVVLIIFLLFFHAFIQVGKGDDTSFQTVLNENNIFEWLAHRYNSWSSRLIIEFFVAIISGSSFSMETIKYSNNVSRWI